MKCEHISVSRKGCWNECPYQYKCKYHEKITSLEPEPFYFVFGKLVHKIAEEYVDNKGLIEIGDIANDVIEGKIEIEEGKIAPPMQTWPPEYKPKLPECLKSVERISNKIGYDGENYLEYPFYKDLDPPNEMMAKGFIDRLIVKDDKYFIIDYKTTKKGKWRKNRNNITADLQLRFYAKIIQEDFNAPADKISAALYYLLGGNLIGAKFSQESLDRAKRELLEAEKQILATPPEQAMQAEPDNIVKDVIIELFVHFMEYHERYKTH